MKRWMSAAVILAVACLATARGQQQTPVRPAAEYVPGEVLVQYRRAVQPARRDAVAATRRGRVLRRFAELDIDHVTLDPTDTVDTAVAALRALPEVAAVSRNYIRHAVQTQSPPPNDPRWLDGSLWGLIKIQAQSAWNTLNARGDGSVVIMDIDTGMNYNHQDLAANAWTNPGETGTDAQGHNKQTNGIDDDGDGYVDDVHGIDTVNHDSNPIDDNGHGTHTAGTLAAVGNNGLGVVGVNWNAKILPCKFLAANGSGSDAGAIECLNYAVNLKTQHGINIRVTSNSWGGYGADPTLQPAFDAAGAAGIISFAAAGNDSVNIDLPQNDFTPAIFARTSPSVVAVASSDQSDNLSSFSNYGVNTVALSAPGSGILSTYYTTNSSYATLSGTSMATPHVAGTAALLSSLDPTLNVGQLKALLTNNVDVLSSFGGLVSTGGRLNVYRAASAVSVPSTLPAPWVTQDIGTVGATGNASALNGVFTIQGAGDDIWNNADAFRFVYQSLTGDGTIVARVTGIQNTNVWAKAGVMIRQDLTPGAVNAAVVVTPGNGVSFQRRVQAGAMSLYTQRLGPSAPYWIKLDRSGVTITASMSPDGVTWTPVGSDTVGMSSAVYVGLAVTSHSYGVIALAGIDNVTITGFSSPSPIAELPSRQR